MHAALFQRNAASAGRRRPAWRRRSSDGLLGGGRLPRRRRDHVRARVVDHPGAAGLLRDQEDVDVERRHRRAVGALDPVDLAGGVHLRVGGRQEPVREVGEGVGGALREGGVLLLEDLLDRGAAVRLHPVRVDEAGVRRPQRGAGVRVARPPGLRELLEHLDDRGLIRGVIGGEGRNGDGGDDG